jgi:uncharacterized protein (DUF885 family)
MRLLALALCFLFALRVGAVPNPGDVDARRKQLNDLITEYWEYSLKQSPVFASIIGDKRYNDQLGSDSEKAILEDQAQKKAFLKRFEAIDTTGFATQDKLNRELEVRDLRNDIEEIDLKLWEMPVSQVSGIHIQAPQLVSILSFETVKDYEDYIARLAPEQTPFAQPFDKFPANFSDADKTRLKAAGIAAIRDQVLPAYAKFAKFVKDDYAPNGRTEIGIWSLPNGDAIYAFMVKRSTTTDKTPEQIHQIGLQQVAMIEDQELQIAKSLGFKDLKTFEAAVKASPKLFAASREQILDLYRGYIAQMEPELPKLFNRLPKAKCIVMPVESFREKDASGASYVPGTPDGSRPGHIMVNTSDPEKRTTVDMESTAYHEGIPGHHMQLSIAQEMPDLPPFRQHGFYGAFIEGWALYSEQLGKEVGFYKDPYNDYGRLEDQQLRAIRLVVDTGIHYKHWTRDQVVQYFHDHSAIDEPNVQSETNRYISWPGQALSYKMGQLKILELRAHAQQELGSKFDIREFHDQVIDSGALPLDVLDQQINDWIAQKQATSAGQNQASSHK